MRNFRLLSLLIVMSLTACSSTSIAKEVKEKSMIEELSELPESTSYALLKYQLLDAVDNNKIGNIRQEDGVWKFQDFSGTVSTAEHTIKITEDSVLFDTKNVNKLKYTNLISSQQMIGLDNFDSYITDRASSTKPGTIVYQPPYTSMLDVNNFLLEHVEHQNSFNITKTEMERIITTLFLSDYTITQFAALGETDYYLTLYSPDKDVVLYYSGSRLLIGGFIFNDEEGLLL